MESSTPTRARAEGSQRHAPDRARDTHPTNTAASSSTRKATASTRIGVHVRCRGRVGRDRGSTRLAKLRDRQCATRRTSLEPQPARAAHEHKEGNQRAAGVTSRARAATPTKRAQHSQTRAAQANVNTIVGSIHGPRAGARTPVASAPARVPFGCPTRWGSLRSCTESPGIRGADSKLCGNSAVSIARRRNDPGVTWPTFVPDRPPFANRE
jgi:hypothetical protein